MPRLFDADRFSLSATCNLVTQALRGHTPDVIVGISLGRLILPSIAVSFPLAKLIFLATGPRLLFQNRVLRKVLPFFGTAVGSSVFGLLRRIPFDTFLSVYMFFGKRMVSTERRDEELARDMAENVKMLRDITQQFQRDIVRFAISVDNAALLKTLPNKTLIISGDRDPLMSLALGKEMNTLIPNSELVISRTQDHAKVFQPSVYPRIDAFLRA